MLSWDAGPSCAPVSTSRRCKGESIRKTPFLQNKEAVPVFTWDCLFLT
jgi:hypothetical protein